MMFGAKGTKVAEREKGLQMWIFKVFGVLGSIRGFRGGRFQYPNNKYRSTTIFFYFFYLHISHHTISYQGGAIIGVWVF
jgi:hypothetical protein